MQALLSGLRRLVFSRALDHSRSHASPNPFLQHIERATVQQFSFRLAQHARSSRPRSFESRKRRRTLTVGVPDAEPEAAHPMREDAEREDQLEGCDQQLTLRELAVQRLDHPPDPVPTPQHHTPGHIWRRAQVRSADCVAGRARTVQVRALRKQERAGGMDGERVEKENGRNGADGEREREKERESARASER
eukprot:1390697-Rhodomonas_salina.5